ncbi:MAG TPA: adenylyl-sulfate kinase [Candidatus Lokiarchaeia archaeon]|nr:adenylyl-sulfate kinase [Candidatus Lokiarchaeia archaeon]
MSENTHKQIDSKGFTVWFTGLACSGKSTIADALVPILKEKGFKVERLDGDIVRKSLTRDLGFSVEDRRKNIERVTFVAKLLTRNDVVVLATFISPEIEMRDNARNEIGNFVEVYVKCSIEGCMARDVKGMYKKAIAGEIKDFTGIHDTAPYEEPPNPELVLDTEECPVDECVDQVMAKLNELGYVEV